MKMSLKNKLQVCKQFLFNQKSDDIQVEYCIYCNSLNVKIEHDETRNIKHDSLVDLTIWEAQYRCNDCGSKCHVKEIWNK